MNTTNLQTPVVNITTRFCREYECKKIGEILRSEYGTAENIPLKKGNNRIAYYNIPCAFDIETSSFLTENGKAALMYFWVVNFDGLTFYGRTWEQYIETIKTVSDFLLTDLNKRLRVYVHNLSYEFQFMRKYFEWYKVFATEERKVLECVDTAGIEYRCSYQLSGYSLNNLANQLQTYKFKKLVGDLDYKLIRTSETPMTDAEKQYCFNDGKIVVAYIQEKIDAGENIPDIPLTKTGYVRQYCKHACFFGNARGRDAKKRNKAKYYNFIKQLAVTPDEYKMLKRAFMGGFTHANAIYARRTLENVGSYDETSAYPAAEVAEKYPMSKGVTVEPKTIKEFDYYIKHFNCIFDICIEDLEPLLPFDNPLSYSKCRVSADAILNNGRIVYASRVETTITEIDFFIICAFYKWGKIKIGKLTYYKKGYLPTDLIKAILDLYKKKTELKGVEGKETEYMQSKERINANYGMMVTDIARANILYDPDSDKEPWKTEPDEVTQAIEKYNKSRKRFLFYPWGVYITAYARKNLFSAIMELKDDYIYADTDSVKGLNMERHKDFFIKYNNNIIDKLQRACDYHKIPYDYIMPKTVKGVEKPLGVWDFEGTYGKFKTLGAKRYMTYKDGKLNITVSGVNKKAAVPYILKKAGGDIEKAFKLFDDDLYIPKGYTGKNILTYIDAPKSGTIKDYLGSEYKYNTLSGVHMDDGDYNLSLSEMYKQFINGVYIKNLKG